MDHDTETASTARDLGVPTRLAPAVGRWLPLGEIATGILLIPRATVTFGATAALGLSSLFLILTFFAIVRGTGAACNCFGSVKKLSRRSVVRNLLLVLAAISLLTASVKLDGCRIGCWPDVFVFFMSTGGLQLLVFVEFLTLLVGAWFIFQLLAHAGRTDARLSGFQDASATNWPPAVRAGTLIVFLSPGCSGCNSLLADFESGEVVPPSTTLIIAGGPFDRRERETVPILTDTNGEMARRFGVTSYPCVFDVGQPERVLAVGYLACQTLLGRASRTTSFVSKDIP